MSDKSVNEQLQDKYHQEAEQRRARDAVWQQLCEARHRAVQAEREVERLREEVRRQRRRVEREKERHNRTLKVMAVIGEGEQKRRKEIERLREECNRRAREANFNGEMLEEARRHLKEKQDTINRLHEQLGRAQTSITAAEIQVRNSICPPERLTPVPAASEVQRGAEERGRGAVRGRAATNLYWDLVRKEAQAAADRIMRGDWTDGVLLEQIWRRAGCNNPMTLKDGAMVEEHLKRAGFKCCKEHDAEGDFAKYRWYLFAK